MDYIQENYFGDWVNYLNKTTPKLVSVLNYFEVPSSPWNYFTWLENTILKKQLSDNRPILIVFPQGQRFDPNLFIPSRWNGVDFELLQTREGFEFWNRLISVSKDGFKFLARGYWPSSINDFSIMAESKAVLELGVNNERLPVSIPSVYAQYFHNSHQSFVFMEWINGNRMPVLADCLDFESEAVCAFETLGLKSMDFGIRQLMESGDYEKPVLVDFEDFKLISG